MSKTRLAAHTLLACLGIAGLAASLGVARAETVLRLDESPIGELDPAKATDYADSILMFNVYDTLVLPQQGGPGVQPGLAASWSQSGNVYRFKLREGVKFHSGNGFGAEDVVYSYTRLMALQQGYSSLFVDRIAKVEAPDATTVTFTLNGPFAPFLASLVRLPIIDSKLALAHKAAGKYGEAGDYAETWLATHDAGTGAYKVDAHNPESQTDLSKFPGYFLGVPAAAPDKVRFRYGIEASTIRTLMASGEHDISSQWLPPEVIKVLAARDDMQLLSDSGKGEFYIKMNTVKPPLDDVHCRRALTYAFDYGTALKMVAISKDVSQGSPANGPLPHGMMGSDDAPNYAQDMKAAKAELAQCKYKPAETPLEITWIAEVPAEERYALLMQANFTQLGFKPTIKRVPWALLTEMVTKPETSPNLSQLYNTAVTPDPDSLLFNMYDSAAKGTWQSPEYLSDAAVDALLASARSEVDPAKRIDLYRQAQARLRALAPTIFAQDLREVFVARKAIKVPALTEAAKRFSLDGYGFAFRLIEMGQ